MSEGGQLRVVPSGVHLVVGLAGVGEVQDRLRQLLDLRRLILAALDAEFGGFLLLADVQLLAA